MKILIITVISIIAFTCIAQQEEVLEAPKIIQDKPTTEEVASAMGITPYCANLKFQSPIYARLVAEVVNEKGENYTREVGGGEARGNYRIRIFCFENIKSRKAERVIFNLSGEENVWFNGLIEFPPESGTARLTLGTGKEGYLYEIWIFGPNSSKDYFRVRFRIETSPTRFPVPSSNLKLIEVKTKQ